MADQFIEPVVKVNAKENKRAEAKINIDEQFSRPRSGYLWAVLIAKIFEINPLPDFDFNQLINW